MTNVRCHHRVSMLWKLCTANRYVIISVLLLLVMVFHSFFGKWVSDFWEHSAVVRELSTNIFEPQHPLFIVDKSHPFFSPYLVLISLFARFFSLTAIDILTVAGIFNLVFFLVGLRLFVQCFFVDRWETICFYALIFILFLWPVQAWSWSGFVHFKVLGYALPYPSTFALAITLLIFALYYRALQSFRKRGLFSAALLTGVVLVTHPTTALFTIIGVCAISLHYYKQQGSRAIVVGLLLLIGAGIFTLLWPYYSFLELVGANNAEFHSNSYTLYKNAFWIWPTLMVLPFALVSLASRFKQNCFDALVLMLCGSAMIYVLGFITGQFGIGRIISCIVIIIQIAAAAWFAKVETNRQANYLRYAPIVVFVLVAIVALNSANFSVFDRSLKGLQGLRYSYAEYEAVGQYIDQYDVVLTDPSNSLRMPTFGGKVIASRKPAHWIDDHKHRRKDLRDFFADNVEMTDKLAIIDKYSVDFILIDRNKIERPEAYFDFGSLVHENKKFILIAINNE